MKKSKEDIAREAALKVQLAKKLAVLQQVEAYRGQNKVEFFTKPKPDGIPANEPQSELLGAWSDRQYKVLTYTGANRTGKCLTYQTLIDTPQGRKPVGLLYEKGEPFDVYAWSGDAVVVTRACAPFKKDGRHQCYKIEMSDGQIIEAADHHRILMTDGTYATVQHLAAFFPGPLWSKRESSRLVHVLSGQRWYERLPDFLGYCFGDSRQHDEQPHLAEGTFVAFLPSLGGVLRRIFYAVRRGAQACKSRYIRFCQLFSHLSIPGVLPLTEARSFGFVSHIYDKILLPFWPVCRLSRQFSSVEVVGSPQGLLVGQHRQRASCSWTAPFCVGGNSIYAITPIPTRQEVYDFEVPDFHNYLAGGLVHHNTTIGAIIAINTAAGKWLWSGEKIMFPHNKPRKIRYIGQDWEKHIKAVVIPALREWWPANRPVSVKKNSLGIESFWVDEITGSTIEIMSNNQDADLHEGWHGDLIIYDEPPRREIRVANARGLIDRLGRELFCMTLLKEAWVDREVIKARNADGSPDTSVYNIHADIYANVGFGITAEGVEQFKKTLTADEVSARIDGKPAYMSGLVAKNFDRKLHLKRRFEVPLDWVVDIAIDIHPRKEQAVLFVATSDRNFRYVVDEIWDHGDGTWVAEQIIRRVKRAGYRVGAIICDPLAKGDANNENTTFDKIDKVLAQHGYYLQTASKDKQSGIIELNNHLLGPNNEPSLFFFNDLVRTLYEIEGWQYDKETQKPAKHDDDMMENLYRILLLDTRYEPPGDEEEPEETTSTANAYTGY